LIGFLRAFDGSVEAVGVLHYELACAHDAEAGAYLVAEFRLYLVEVDRELLVGADVAPDDVRHDLFVRRPDAEFALGPVLEAEELLAVVIPAPALFPELGRDDGGHQYLDGPRPVHLLADDVLDLG